MRILTVVDGLAAVTSIRVLLGESGAGAPGFESVHAPTLAQAVELLQQPDFDLVLLDLGLSDSEGAETLARVRAAQTSLPIIVLTGLRDEQLATDALRQGAQDFLVKGQFDGAMLARAIRYAIERQRSDIQLRHRGERETALREINLAITSTLELASVVDLLLEWIVRLFPSYAITLRLADPTTRNLEQFACRNLDEAAWRNLPARASPTGVVQTVAASRKTLAVVDVREYPVRYPEFMRAENLVSYLGVPLLLRDDFIGMMGIYSREMHIFGQEEIDFFNALGAQAAVAISNSRLFERVKTASEKALVLRQINLAMITALDLDTCIKVLMDKVVQVYPDCAVTLRLLNKETGAFVALACRNLDEREWKSLDPRIGSGGLHQIARRQGPVAIIDAPNDPRVQYRDFLRRNGLISYLGVPLNFRDEFVGVLGCFTRERYEFRNEEIEFLGSLADQAAVALYNAQLYDRLKDSNETLEKALEAKSMLAGVMAHELKTPIQVIMGSASMLADHLFGELTPEQRGRVRVIEAGGEELLKLIDSTLALARAEHGVTALAVTEVCVAALIAELKSEFEEAFRVKGVELEIDAPPPGSITIKTDRIKLKEILRNLVDNARKFTQQGKVTVRAGNAGKERLEFVVSDTGIGIRGDLLPKIYESFYQVSYSDKERASAGLGLSIVKRLVEALSGEIHVASEVGKGTTFHVSLPREIASAAAGDFAAPGE